MFPRRTGRRIPDHSARQVGAARLFRHGVGDGGQVGSIPELARGRVGSDGFDHGSQTFVGATVCGVDAQPGHHRHGPLLFPINELRARFKPGESPFHDVEAVPHLREVLHGLAL